MNNTGKIMIGFLLGGMIGMATGLLIAPASGKQTRKKISKRSKKLAEQVAGYIGTEDKLYEAGSKRSYRKASAGV